MKTAVPPGVGEGLVTSDKASVDKLIAQNSMVSVSINQPGDGSKGELESGGDDAQN